MDTDVELFASLESLRGYAGFLPFEFETRLNTGMGFGGEKHNCVIYLMLKDYADRHFVKENGEYDVTACTFFNTNALEQSLLDLKLNDSFQMIDDFAFLPTSMYNQFARHHYASSWTNTPKTKIAEPRIYKDTRLKRFLRNPDRQAWIRRNTSRQVQFVYTFLAYDLLENGIAYYIKRIAKRWKEK